MTSWALQAGRSLYAVGERRPGGRRGERLLDGRDRNDFRGGKGFDFVSYFPSSFAKTVTLDDVANDGSPGGSDNVRADVEGLYEGDDDHLTGNAEGEQALRRGG